MVQAIYGVLAHSTALLADAGHNLSDVLGLLLAWGATWLATRRPSARYTFGYGSSSILASLVNAGLLLFACGVIVAEAIGRLMNPAPVAGLAVFVVATVGMVVNGFSAWLFMRGQKEDLNIRGAFLHMAADAGISAAVALSGLVILYTHWMWLDPVMSLRRGRGGGGGHVGPAARFAAPRARRRAARHRPATHPRLSRRAARRHRRARPARVGAVDDRQRAQRASGDAGGPSRRRVDRRIVVALRERFSMQHATLQVDLGTTEHRCALDHAPHAH